MFIGNSAKYSDIGHPFGFLKASTNLQTVNLFVMPYNYPALIPLLGERTSLASRHADGSVSVDCGITSDVPLSYDYLITIKM